MNTTDIDDALRSFPALRGDAEYTDSDRLADLKEWAESAKTMLEQARVVCAERDTAVEQLEEVRGELTKTSRRADMAETNLSELHIAVKQALDAESTAEALTMARQLRAERDQLRRMYDGAVVDLGSARDEVATVASEGAARELKLTEELAEARQLRKMYDGASTDLDNARRECEVLRLEFNKVRDSLTNDVAFFKRKAEARGAELQLAISKIEDLSARYNCAADEVQAHAEQHGKEMAERCPHKASSCTRTHTRLTAKIKRLVAATDVKKPSTKTRKRESYASANAANKATRTKTKKRS